LVPHRVKHLHVRSDAPTAFPVGGDGLGASDAVLGRVGPKMPLGRTTGGGKASGVPQIPLGASLGARLEML
jgi:hypothetical protein